MIRTIAEEHGDALTNQEIDALCQKLNLDYAPKRPDADLSAETVRVLDNLIHDLERVANHVLLSCLHKLRAKHYTAATLHKHIKAASHPDTDMHRAGCPVCQYVHDKNLPDA